MGIKYILTAVKPSPLYLPRTFSSSPMKLYTVNPLLLPLAPGNHHSLCVSEFDCLRHLI